MQQVWIKKHEKKQTKNKKCDQNTHTQTTFCLHLAYPACRPVVQLSGGKWCSDQSCVDGTLVTAQGLF